MVLYERRPFKPSLDGRMFRMLNIGSGYDSFIV